MMRWVLLRVLVLFVLVVELSIATQQPNCPHWPRPEDFPAEYRTAPRDVVLYTLGRSMSTLAIELLYRAGFATESEPWHPSFQCFYRHYVAAQAEPGISPPYPPNTLAQVQDGIKILFSRGWEWPRAGRYLAFKIFPDQVSWFSWTQLCQPGGGLICDRLKVIHLIREDYFASTLSLLEAMHFNQWQITPENQDQMHREPVSFSEEKIAEFVELMTDRCVTIELQRRDLQEAAALGYVTSWEVHSETLVAEDQAVRGAMFDQLATFLEIEQHGTPAMQRAFQAMKASSTQMETNNRKGRHALPYRQRVVDFVGFLDQVTLTMKSSIPNFHHKGLSRNYDADLIAAAVNKCEHLLWAEVAELRQRETDQQIREVQQRVARARDRLASLKEVKGRRDHGNNEQGRHLQKQTNQKKRSKGHTRKNRDSWNDTD